MAVLPTRVEVTPEMSISPLLGAQAEVPLDGGLWEARRHAPQHAVHQPAGSQDFGFCCGNREGDICQAAAGDLSQFLCAPSLGAFWRLQKCPHWMLAAARGEPGMLGVQDAKRQAAGPAAGVSAGPTHSYSNPR